MSDMVNNPPHYQRGGMEAIDVIENWGLGMHLGNALKYILRCGYKGGTVAHRIEDLRKALWYMNRVIARVPLERHFYDSGFSPISGCEVVCAFGLDGHLEAAVMYIRTRVISLASKQLSLEIKRLEAEVSPALTTHPAFPEGGVTYSYYPEGKL